MKSPSDCPKLRAKRSRDRADVCRPLNEEFIGMTLAAAPLLVEVANFMEEVPEPPGQKRKLSQEVFGGNYPLPWMQTYPASDQESGSELDTDAHCDIEQGRRSSEKEEAKQAPAAAEQTRKPVGKRRRSRGRGQISGKTKVTC